MEDQGKRLMLAAALAFGIMMVWSFVFPPEKPIEEATNGKVENKASAEVADNSPSTKAETKKVDEKLPRGEEVFFNFKFDNLDIQFSSYGASLKSWKFLAENLEDRSVKPYQPDDIIKLKDDAHPFLGLSFPDSTFSIPLGSEWKGEKKSDTEIQFVWESSDIKVVKNIIIHPKDYVLTMNVEYQLTGATTAKQALAVSLFGKQDPNIEGGGMFNRSARVWKGVCFEDEEKTEYSSKELESGIQKRSGLIDWAGFDQIFFLAAASVLGGNSKGMECNVYPLPAIVGGMGLDLVQKPVELKEGEPTTSTITVFLGPKVLDKLTKVDEIANRTSSMDEAINFGWFGLISKPLLALLRFLFGVVGNWGIAILLLTIIVKAATLPWTHKSMKSMKAMARLKPQLEKIKEKYKDDRNKQNLETMALFKKHNANPMSGCLPMLLQMPIWFALYRGLSVAGELYQSPFIPGWIEDLSLPDPFYIMPVITMGIMFLQMRITPTTGSGAQQKMLQFGMPVMFGIFSIFFPAGLTLYIFTNTCITASHHLYMHKTEPVSGVALDVDSKEVIDIEETLKEESKTSKPTVPKNNKMKKKTGKNKGKRK